MLGIHGTDNHLCVVLRSDSSLVWLSSIRGKYTTQSTLHSCSGFSMGGIGGQLNAFTEIDCETGLG